ncbi:DUF3592 domain-containing protein [Dokdonella immobilis]|uniref:DUF3592 domain-containing protein n=1 Tax=Dokdonella immobilis TaxID=578942 RepID=A0A1I4Y6E3_9GAMM|nr:DUF3592 domain-containing protein [Dokdonella immobilis]SFN33611.1 hypothetical protein SAMN05216289_11541 [Dokdonella immobilis]
MNRFLSLAIGIVCLCGSAYMAKRTIEFRRHGEVVSGEVIAVDRQLTHGEDGFDLSERTQVRYTPRSGGPPLEMHTQWGTAWIFHSKPGDPQSLRYLPDNSVDAREDSWLIDLLGPVTFLLLGVGGLTGSLTSSRPESVLWSSSDD